MIGLHWNNLKTWRAPKILVEVPLCDAQKSEKFSTTYH